ncbi:MAG: hypothetical protein ACR2LV_12240 [Solirubrobacteraceae bacterium]
MKRISIGLWLALAGAILEFVALGSNFYVLGSGSSATTRDAWLGIPHASDLLLVSALITVIAVVIAARGNSPLRGRNFGWVVALFGALATAQLVYRMIVPPFGCLTYSCGTTAKAAHVTLLTGIWIGVIGAGLTLVGGVLHAFSAAAGRLPARPPLAERQAGLTPWLGLSAIGMVVAFVAPFTGFEAYKVGAFFGAAKTSYWSGWLSLPHTSSLVLACMIMVLLLVLAAARRRAPLPPAAMGAVVGVLAFVVASRELLRVFSSPFSTAGGASNVHTGVVTVLPAFWVGLAAAVVAVLVAVVQAVLYYDRVAAPERRRPAATPAGDPAGTVA